MAVAGSLVTTASAKTDDFSRGMKAMRDDLGRTTQAAESTSQGFVALGRSTLALAGTAVSLGALKNGLQEIVTVGLQMERLRNSFTAITGDLTKSRQEFGFVRDTANRLGLGLDELGNSYRGLLASTKGTNLEGQTTRDLFTSLTNASRAYGLSTEQTGRVLLAFQQIISKGKVSQEELRQQLGEALPGALQIAARAFGVTTQELELLIEKGLDSSTFIKKFIDQLNREVPAGTAVAGSGFARLGNEILGLKDSIAQSGVLKFLDDLAARGAGILAANRQGREAVAAAERGGISSLGVNPDLSRRDLVSQIAAANKAIKAQEENLTRLLAEDDASSQQGQSTATGIFNALTGRDQQAPNAVQGINQAIVRTRQELESLRAQRQELISLAQQEGLEQQRIGAHAAQSNQEVAERLRKEAEAAASKLKFNEIAAEAEKQDDKEAEARREDEIRAVETGAKADIGLLRQTTEAKQQYLDKLGEEVDRLKLTAEQLDIKLMLEQGLNERQEQRARLLLEEKNVLQQIKSLNDIPLQTDEIGPAAARERAAVLKENARDTRRELRDTEREVKEFADFFTSTILSATDIGKQGFRSFIDSVVADLQRLLARQYLAPVLKDVVSAGLKIATGLLGGGTGAGAASLDSATGIGGAGLGSVPGLASGGPVMGPGFYTVGEQGPELLAVGRGQSGYIYPNGQAGGVTVNFYGVTDAGSFRRSQGEIQQRIAQAIALGQSAA